MCNRMASSMRAVSFRPILLIWALVLLGNPGGSTKAQTPRQVVLVSHRVTDVSSVDAENVVASAILPLTNKYQEVESAEIDRSELERLVPNPYMEEKTTKIRP